MGVPISQYWTSCQPYWTTSLGDLPVLFLGFPMMEIHLMNKSHGIPTGFWAKDLPDFYLSFQQLHHYFASKGHPWHQGFWPRETWRPEVGSGWLRNGVSICIHVPFFTTIFWIGLLQKSASQDCYIPFQPRRPRDRLPRLELEPLEPGIGPYLDGNKYLPLAAFWWSSII